jgi:hypothetical protein
MSIKSEKDIDTIILNGTGCLPIYDLFSSDTYEEDNRGLTNGFNNSNLGRKVQESAIDFLTEAKEAMEARARLRDSPQGERTAKRIASVFNALTGHSLTETDAWTFLLILKMVRSRSGAYHADDYVDLVSYASLLSECEANSDRAKSVK